MLVRNQYLLDAVGCKLTAKQAEILPCTARYQLVTGGDQAGKSMLASKKFLSMFIDDLTRAKAANYSFPLIYWLVAADYDRTEQEFNYIKNDLALLGLLHRASKRVDPGFIEIGGGPASNPVVAVVRTKSAKDYRTLAKEAPMGIIGCEASQIDLESYLRLVARTAPHRAWLFLTGTMESSMGWYPQLRIAWSVGQLDKRSFSLPSYSNLYLYPGGRDDPEIVRMKNETPDDFFMERIEGVPCPPTGLVFGEFNAELHVSLDAVYVPGEPVSVWYDPGYDHAAALEASQTIGGQVRVFAEVYERNLTIDEVIDIAVAQPWWHDVRHGVIDVAGSYHSGQQTPVAEVWMNRTGLYMHGKKVPINDGTDRLKSFLKVDPITHRPKLIFAPTCVGVLSELGCGVSPIDKQVHVYKWDVDREGNTVGKVPRDRWNDGIKAIIYGLVDRFGYVNPQGIGAAFGMQFFGRKAEPKRLVV